MSTLTMAPMGSHRINSPHQIAMQGLMVIGIGMIFMLLWIQAAPISGAVVTEGIVKADGERKTVSHQEGGIIKTIHVQDGDHVEAGQVLVTLEDVRIGAGLDSLLVQQDAEQARMARLSAERDLQSTIHFPGTWQNRRSETRLSELIQKENAAFQARRQALTSQIQLMDRQRREIEQEIVTLHSLTTTTQHAHDLATQELTTNEKLHRDGFISSLRIDELRRNQTDYQARHEQQLQELAKAEQKLTELQLNKNRLQTDFTKQANDELKDSTNRLFKLEEDLRPLQDAQLRQTIVAPVAGEIVDLKLHTLGAPIGPREPILDIVPAATQLVIEAHIKPENIKELVPQGEADIRLTAYKQRSTPILEGKVIYVGADRLTDKQTGQPYYLSRLMVPSEAIEKASRLAGHSIALQQGMQAEVFIKTEARSALDYLLEPVTSGLRRSLRER